MSNENATLQTRDKSEDRSKAHPWRVCPVGYHYVRTHKVHTKPGKEHPQGLIVTRHGHCAKNPTRKNIMTYDEHKEISSEYFSQLTDGLMQVMDGTLKILNDPHGELKDHLLYIPPEKILEPSANICAGIRWLFQKKHLADYRLKRDATWGNNSRI